MKRLERTIVGGVCTGFIALSATYALILPPGEGFDEGAHYSYVSALADQGIVPDFRSTPLDSTVELELHDLPRPYAGVPPFEVNGGMTYAEFFDDLPVAERRRIIDRFWEPPTQPAAYSPATTPNWQGQHPPLYYAIMTIPYRMTKEWSPGARWLTLRGVSVLLACTSLVFWWQSVLVVPSPQARRALLSAGVVVLFLPSCWFDLARLGNDSLAAPCSAAILYCLLRTCGHRLRSLGDFTGAGIAIGCGLLTKGFFVPIMVGAIAFIAWHGATVCRLGWRPLAVRGLIVAAWLGLLAGPWHLQCWFRYGMWVPSEEAYRLHGLTDMPGDALGMLDFGRALVRSCFAFAATFLWCGGWSWVKRPLWHYAMMVPLGLLTLGNPATRGDRSCPDARYLRRIVFFLLAPLLGCLFWYMIQRIRWTAVGSGVGGYYLFSCWTLVGLALWRCLDADSWRADGLRLALPAMRIRLPAHAAVWGIAVSLTLAVGFEISGLWFSAQIYAGLVQKLGSESTGVGGVWPTLENCGLVFSRLRELAHPGWALAPFLVSLVARLITVVAVLRLGAEGVSTAETRAFRPAP